MATETRCQNECLCEHGWASLGRFNGLNMGKGWSRLTTDPACPIHALCQGYSAGYRAQHERWGRFWCPVHETQNCPTRKAKR